MSGSSKKEWSNTDHSIDYLKHADLFIHRKDGEKVLLDIIPEDVTRVLDIGSSDGRLIRLVKEGIKHNLLSSNFEFVAIDVSPTMINALKSNFKTDKYVNRQDQKDAGRAAGPASVRAAARASRITTASAASGVNCTARPPCRWPWHRRVLRSHSGGPRPAPLARVGTRKARARIVFAFELPPGDLGDLGQGDDRVRADLRRSSSVVAATWASARASGSAIVPSGRSTSDCDAIRRSCRDRLFGAAWSRSSNCLARPASAASPLAARTRPAATAKTAAQIEGSESLKEENRTSASPASRSLWRPRA